MKVIGWILLVFGGLALIGSIAGGNSAFGPLFWMALGFVLIYFGKKKEEKAQTDNENKGSRTIPNTPTVESFMSQTPPTVESLISQTPTDVEKVETAREGTGAETKSYGKRYKIDNPEKASQLSSIYGIDISLLTEKDIRERISTVDRLCHQYQCTIPQLKGRCLKDMEQFPLSFFDQLIEMTEKEKEKEAANFNIARENTACALLVEWMKERRDFLETNNVYNMPIGEESDAQLSPEDSFKKRYSKTLVSRIGSNANIPLFCEGYDSPIAHELMDVMYAFLKDKTEKEKADNLGYGKRYIFIITEETEKVVKKYCHAALQECIEYYKFPNKKVVTSFRCPHCGSWKVWNEDYGFECGECGCTWHAPLGYNLYLDMDNN